MKKIRIIFYLLVLSGSVIVSSCKKENDDESLSENELPENRPPVADAGSDTTIYYPSGYAVLNGAGSYDPDGETDLKYSWTVSSDTALNLIIHTSSLPVTSAFNLITPGEYEFNLTVTDVKGLVDRDKFTVRVVDSVCAKTSEIVLKDQVWHDDGWGWMVIYADFNSLTHNGNFERMFIRRDGAKDWEEVIIYDLYTNYANRHTFTFGDGWLYIYPPDPSAVGDTPDIKIVYCN